MRHTGLVMDFERRGTRVDMYVQGIIEVHQSLFVSILTRSYWDERYGQGHECRAGVGEKVEVGASCRGGTEGSD